MIDQDREILEGRGDLVSQGIFAATLKGHGLFNTFQFVLRLSPAVHRKLAGLPIGIVNSSMIDLQSLEAFSTYLHETVHWWQHIGSTYGFMLSMTYPAQTHANYQHLKNLSAQIGFKKSIHKLAESLPGGGLGSPSALANIIINNHFDMDAFRGLTISPRSASAIVENPLFENLGHCYHIAYGNILSLLASVSDHDYQVIPSPKQWSEPFKQMRESKEQGYYYGSPISLYPIGAYEIFEGQARMAQLQYLHFGTGGTLDLEHANETGMFNGVYGVAFTEYLRLCELERPTSIDHPTIALFLLICDLTINPGSGFPFPLVHFKSFIHDLEPGARFVSLCRLARLKHPDVFKAICNYSRQEYMEVSEKLCHAMVEHPPLEIAQEFCRWTKNSTFKDLMAEHVAFKFEKNNVVARILFSHFLNFMRDKFDRPEFFCWPGVYMAGDKLESDAMTLFDRHSALFVDKEDDDGIYPRLLSGRSEDALQAVFQDFYANNVIYDLTRQWIVQEGSFNYDYRWLSKNGTDDEIQNFAESTFASVYGMRPSSAVIL